jgi:peptidoglycan/LPS O-acetylase OafA/YrhL
MPARARTADRPRAAAPVSEAPAVLADGHVPALTGLRGLAAFAVFAFHAWGMSFAPDPAPGLPGLSAVLAWLLRIGWAGVDVFFTLSAFLLALPFARAAISGKPAPATRTYLRRRCARILPAYWLQLALLVVGLHAGLTWGSTTPAAPGPGAALAHVVLGFNAWPRVEPLLPHWWTLPVEFGFYLLLPLLARAFAPRRWPWLLALVAFAWLWRMSWLLHPRGDFAQWAWIEHLPGRIDQFAVGMLAAWAWARRGASGLMLAPRRADVLALASACAFLAMPALLLLDGRGVVNQGVSLHPVVLAWHGLASVAVAGMLVACCAGAPVARHALAARPIRFLGTISYSFYLWHLPVILLARGYAGGRVEPGDFWPFSCACLVATLVLATLSWWLVERPAMRWAARR